MDKECSGNASLLANLSSLSEQRQKHPSEVVDYHASLVLNERFPEQNVTPAEVGAAMKVTGLLRGGLIDVAASVQKTTNEVECIVDDWLKRVADQPVSPRTCLDLEELDERNQ